MSDNSNANKRIARNTLFLTFRLLFTLVVSLYTSRITLQVLGVSDFGVQNVVGSVVGMFSFLTGCLVNGIQRFYNFELGKNGNEGAHKVYVNSVIIQLLLAVVICVLLETVGLWFLYNKLVIPEDRFDAAFWIFQMSIIGTFISIMRVPFDTAIISHEKMDYYAYITILDVVLKLVFIINIPHIPGDRLILYGLFGLFVSVLDWFLYFIYAKKKFPEVYFELKTDKVLLKSMLGFSGWNMFGTLCNMLKDQGINILLNMFFGPVVNAARGVAFQVNSAIKGFVGNVNMAGRPQLMQAYAQENKQRTLNLMYSLSKLCFFTLFIMALPICVEIDYILHLWLGENVPDNTNIFVVFVLLTTLFYEVNAPTAMVVHATGKLRTYQIVTSAVGLMIVPVAYICLKLGMEPVVVFVVTFIFEAINYILTLFLLRAIYSYSIRDYSIKVILPILAISIISFIPAYIPHYLMADGFGRLCVVTATSVVSVLSLTYFIGMNASEKNLLTSFLKTKLNKK